MKLKDIFSEIMTRLSEIGEIEIIGISNNHKTNTRSFKYKILGKRKTSDFKTLEIMSQVQKEFLSAYPIAHKVIMDDEIIEVELKEQ